MLGSYAVTLGELEKLAATSLDADLFCEVVIDTLKPYIELETIILFIQVDNETLESKARSGPEHGNLIGNKYLKFFRKSPMADAYRLGKPQDWGDAQKMLKEYPDLILWPRILHGVVAIPLLKDKRAYAGCVYVSRDGFPEELGQSLLEPLEKTSELIYQVYLRQLEQPSH